MQTAQRPEHCSASRGACTGCTQCPRIATDHPALDHLLQLSRPNLMTLDRAACPRRKGSTWSTPCRGAALPPCWQPSPTCRHAISLALHALGSRAVHNSHCSFPSCSPPTCSWTHAHAEADHAIPACMVRMFSCCISTLLPACLASLPAYKRSAHSLQVRMQDTAGAKTTHNHTHIICRSDLQDLRLKAVCASASPHPWIPPPVFIASAACGRCWRCRCGSRVLWGRTLWQSAA